MHPSGHAKHGATGAIFVRIPFSVLVFLYAQQMAENGKWADRSKTWADDYAVWADEKDGCASDVVWFA